MLNGIKEYALIKNLVFLCAQKNKLVDVNLIKSLIDQVDLRCKMLAIEIKAGDLDYDGNEDVMFSDCLYELSKTEPLSIEQQLADEKEQVD